MTKRELAMQVSNIIHWDFDVRTRKFESYHDPINDYASDKPLTIAEYIEAVHPDDRSAVYDAMQSMLSGKDVTINFTCRIQTKYDDSWQYCNILGVPLKRMKMAKTYASPVSAKTYPNFTNWTKK